MRRRIALIAASLAGSLGLGWISAPLVEPPREARAQILPALQHARTATSALRERLEAFAPVVETANEFAAEAPAPPDISVLFRRDLTAIEQRPDGAIVWVVDFAQDFGRRGLRVGDVYQDGWRVSAIGAQSVELRRRRETRRVAAFAPPLEAAP